MANPANLTVTDLVANAGLAQPLGDTIDSDGTVPVLAGDLAGATDRLVLHITNTDAVNKLNVTVVHGQNPPAVRESLGSLTVQLVASGVALIGPLESARFLQADGTLDVAFATVGGVNAAATARCYLLPRAA